MNIDAFQTVIAYMKDQTDEDFDMREPNNCVIGNASKALGLFIDSDYDERDVYRVLGLSDDEGDAIFRWDTVGNLLHSDSDIAEAIAFLEGIVDGRILFKDEFWVKATQTV